MAQPRAACLGFDEVREIVDKLVALARGVNTQPILHDQIYPSNNTVGRVVGTGYELVRAVSVPDRRRMHGVRPRSRGVVIGEARVRLMYIDVLPNKGVLETLWWTVALSWRTSGSEEHRSQFRCIVALDGIEAFLSALPTANSGAAYQLDWRQSYPSSPPNRATEAYHCFAVKATREDCFGGLFLLSGSGPVLFGQGMFPALWAWLQNQPEIPAAG